MQSIAKYIIDFWEMIENVYVFLLKICETCSRRTEKNAELEQRYDNHCDRKN